MATDSGQSFRRDMPETAGDICLARRVGKGDRMKRSEIRENIFKLVFCGEFHTSSELEDQLNAYLEDVECTDQERSYIAAKFGKGMEDRSYGKGIAGDPSSGSL